MTPTWYSIRNHLESSFVEDNNKNLQFLASMVTAYPCLDIWFRAKGNDVELRVCYMQCNKTFVATDSWERTGEEPKVYQQFKGDWASVRADMITQLPSFSRLSDEKRHGLQNKGAKEPYEGGGMLFDVTGDGELVIQGRYGAIAVEVNGEDLPFRALNYEFNCCTPKITIGPEWLDGGFTITDTPPGYVKEYTYTGTVTPPAPTASLSFVATDAVVHMSPPASVGPDMLLGVLHEWTEGTDYTVPQSGPSAQPAPTLIPGSTSQLNNWPYLFGQGFCTITGTIEDIPLITETETSKIYEKTGVFPMPRFTTTDSDATTITDSGSTDTTYYQSFGSGANLINGTYRITIIDQGDNTKTVSTLFTPDNLSYSISFGNVLTVPSGLSSINAWSATDVELGTRSVYTLYNNAGLPTLGNQDIVAVDLGIDTAGLNLSAQGDYPKATVGANQTDLHARVWRGYLGITV